MDSLTYVSKPRPKKRMGPQYTLGQSPVRTPVIPGRIAGLLRASANDSINCRWATMERIPANIRFLARETFYKSDCQRSQPIPDSVFDSSQKRGTRRSLPRIHRTWGPLFLSAWSNSVWISAGSSSRPRSWTSAARVEPEISLATGRWLADPSRAWVPGWFRPASLQPRIARPVDRPEPF